jgi:hypothetical protein
MIDYPDAVWNKQHLTEHLTRVVQLFRKERCLILKDSMHRLYACRHLMHPFMAVRHHLQSLPLP